MKRKIKNMRDNKDLKIRFRGKLKGKEANDKSNQCVKKKEERKKWYQSKREKMN